MQPVLLNRFNWLGLRALRVQPVLLNRFNWLGLRALRVQPVLLNWYNWLVLRALCWLVGCACVCRTVCRLSSQRFPPTRRHPSANLIPFSFPFVTCVVDVTMTSFR